MKKKLNNNNKIDISRGSIAPVERMERETGFEPATFSLGRRHATAALLPLVTLNITNSNRFGNNTFNEKLGLLEFPVMVLPNIVPKLPGKPVYYYPANTIIRT
jgi:hypothetical protein